MQFSSTFRASLAAASALALLTACAVGPDFATPDTKTGANYDAASMPAQTAAADGTGGNAQKFMQGYDLSADWWQLYHCDGLDRLVLDALKASPDLAAAQASLRVAQEDAAAEAGVLFPTVSGNAGFTRQKTSSGSNGGLFPGTLYNLYNTSASASYALDVFGGNRRAVEEADAQAEYQRYELEAAYISLTANVVTAAVQEASLRGQIAATQEIINEDAKGLNILQAQFDAGAVAKTALLEQQATLAQARANLPPLQKQLSITRHQLSVLTGRMPSEDVGASFNLASLKLPDELPVSLPSDLVAQRPDIKAAEATLHAASAAIGVAEAHRLPQITLSANIGDAAVQVGKLFTPGTGLWSVGGSVAQTIFDGGTLMHRQGAAEAQYDLAAAQYRKTVLTAFQNVADALRTLEADALTLKARVDAAQAAHESLKLAQIQFRDGAVNYLSLLDAEQTNQEAQLTLVQAQAQRYADTAALFQALGGGWWNRNLDISKPVPADLKALPVNAPKSNIQTETKDIKSGDKQ